MEHDLTFHQIKERVALPELLAHHGYALQKGETLGRGKWHVFEGDDKLVVFRGRGGDWMYFNAQDERDKGSVVDWMKNRVATGRLAGLGPLPGRNLWQSVNDHFRAYLNLPEAERPRLALPPLGETAPGERFEGSYPRDCGPLADTAYLEGRGIARSTWEDPQFAGRILNQRHTVQRGQMPAVTYVNTAFPAYHEGRVVGLELKGEGFRGQAADSQFARSLWLSRLPEGQAATHLVVCESAIDALSYSQLHPKKQVLYASTAGTLTQNKIFELKRLMGEGSIPVLRAAFDNDAQGHHFDTRLLAGFAAAHNPMKVVREHAHLLTVEVSAADPAGILAVVRELRDFNARTTAEYHRASGETATAATPPTLRDALIASARPGAGTYQFHVPINREALGAFNQAIGRHLHYDRTIEIAKSQGKDWNEDLKQAQMQRVVRRELGDSGADGPETGQKPPRSPGSATGRPTAPEQRKFIKTAPETTAHAPEKPATGQQEPQRLTGQEPGPPAQEARRKGPRR